MSPQDLIQETPRIYKDLPVGLCYLDRDFRFIHINDWLAEINGIPPEEHLGRTIGELLPDVAAGVEAQFRQVIDTGEPIIGGTVEAETLAQPGIKKYFQYSYYPVGFDDGEVIGISCVVEDITERRRAENSLRAAHDTLEQRVRERTVELEREITNRKHAQESLRGSEQRFKDFAEAASDWFWEIDENLRFTYLSDRLLEIGGSKPEDLLGKTWQEADRRYENNEDWRRHLACLNARRAFRDFQYPCVMPDRSIRHYSISGIPIFDRAGHFKCYRGIGSDITERKRAEGTLRESEARLKAAQRLAKLGHWRWEFKKQRLTDWSEEKARIFGFAADQGKLTWDDISRPLHPDDRDRVLEEYRAADEESQDFEIEYRILTPKGEVRHLHEIGEVEYDDRGKRIAHVGTVQDITERKQAERELEESREILRALADNLPEFISLKDPEGRFLFVNKRFEEWVCVDRNEIVGKTVHDIYSAEQAAEFDALDRQVIASRSVLSNEVDLYYPDGNTRAVVRTRFPVISSGGEVLGLGTINFDVSERKRAEEAVLASEHALLERVTDLEEAKRKLEWQGEDLVRLADDLLIARDEARAADRAKSEFLAAMSHELRTPLNAIIGFSEMIESETLGPLGSVKYRDFAGDIHQSGRHLLGLINDLLDLSKIESGKDELDEDKIEIPEFIRSALKLVRHRAEQGGVKLEVELPDQLPALRADERKLKQILVNLLSNAVKFTGAGGEVTLRAWCRMDSGYVFQIVDTGIGIAPEDIPKALSRFGQVDGDLNRQYEGTGLGLPLTRALVELHGGVLDLQSEVGVGTTVTVRFPAERIVASLDNADSLDVEARAAS